MLNKILTKPVSQIVRDNFHTADVFDKYGISYCCGGNVDFATACVTRGLDVERIGQEITQATEAVRLPGNPDFGKWKQGFLVDFISNVHHAYLLQALPAIDSQLRTFAYSHVKKMPFLSDLLELFEVLSDLLTSQVRYEVEILFPYIRLLDGAIQGNESYGPLFVRTLRKPMGKSPEIEKAIFIFEKMGRLTSNYGLDEKACTTNRVVYQKLQELDRDFRFHNWLEQTYVFPRAIETEAQLLRQ